VAVGHPGAGNMINASLKFTESDHKRIAQRIAKLEEQTDAEVVCAVATESGRYDRAESICGLLVGVSSLIVGNKLVGLSGWDGPASLSVGWQVLLTMAGFVLGSLLASYWHPLRQLFVSRAEMESEVNRSAHLVFSRHGVGGTRHRGGVLIYLSLFERRLEVRCDRAVAEKLATADIESIRDAVLAKLKSGDLPGALVMGLDRAEAILAKAIPGTGLAADALSNDLLLFHPRP